jgi:hypothetical protein
MLTEGYIERAIAQATEGQPPRVSSCPFCQDTHAPGKCPTAAGGGPWEELKAARATIQALRLQLASADEHVGALVAAIEHETQAYNAYMHCLDDVKSAQLASDHSKTARAQSAAADAARAWLRREEPKP